MRRLETVETAAAAALAGLVRGLMAGAATQGGEHGAAEVDHRRGQDAPVVEGTGHGGGGHSSPRNPLEVGALTKQCEALQARWWSQKGRRRAKKASRSLFPGAISCRRAVAPWRPRPLGKNKISHHRPFCRGAECGVRAERSAVGRWEVARLRERQQQRAQRQDGPPATAAVIQPLFSQELEQQLQALAVVFAAFFGCEV